MIQEIAELNRIRLDEDLTLGELAAEIGDIDASTLSRLFDNPDRKPYDRTLHKIRRFLAERKAAGNVAPAKRATA